MNHGAVWAIAGSTVVVIATGVAVGGDGSHLPQQVQNLFGMADTSLDDAMNDLSLWPISVRTAHGSVEDGRVVELHLMADPGGGHGDVVLDRLVVIGNNNQIMPVDDIQVLRDRDYSLPEALNEQDLAVFHFDLSGDPWEPREKRTLTFDVAGHSPGSYEIKVPSSLKPMTRLDLTPMA